MTKPDDDWLRRELVAMTPEEVNLMILRLARRRGDPRMRGKAFHHIDGDPTNNSPENLRIVDIRENRRGKD